MKKHDEIRRRVSEAYGKAVTEGSCSCCGPCYGPTPKGVAARLAGYTPEELAGLPPEAVVNSFGCGNPLAYSEVKEGDVVLDLGSGAGIDLLIAAKKVGPTGRVIGVDMTDEMIEKARENIAASGLMNVEVRKGRIEELPVDEESVDWVISNCVINLSPEKARVFPEVFRVLRPGGRILISDLVARDLPQWVRDDPKLYDSCIAGAISEDRYLEEMQEAGLDGMEVRKRVVYDRAHLADLVSSEGASGSVAARVAEELQGKVASVQIYGRRPVSS